jgi:eukaryotic-like serine/threonine-protein kinase
MDPERWAVAKELLADALEQPEDARQAFLAARCEDADLRAHVESLLRYATDVRSDGGEDGVDRVEKALAAALEGAASELARPRLPFSSATLSRYKVISLLGAGGMGDVYRATDLRLDRDVAIKMLPAHLAKNPRAVRRFEREAKSIAALSHSNILAIHDFAIEDGVSYVVMELLQGETLRVCLQRSAVPWRRAVEIALAVAEGLVAAHGKGIIHRDLKPENIFLTSDGPVKILDFGIARVKRTFQEGAPNQTVLTRPWTVLGTVGYMSPEQLRGEEADSPSDVFAVGCVLYEMVSGQGPFARATTAESMAAILSEETPTLVSRTEVLPASVEGLVRRCLAKSAGDRFQTAGELAAALRTTASTPEPPALPAAPPALTRVGRLRAAFRALSFVRMRPRIWIGGAVLMLALAAVAVLAIRAGLWPRGIESVAVLPLVNVSGNPDVQYLADGLTEDLINSLSQLPQLTRVIARSTVATYQAKVADPRGIARDLNVGAVLNWTMQQRGEALTVQTELIRASDGSRLWGGQYNRTVSSVMALQADITTSVAAALAIRLSDDQRQRLSKRRTDNSEANALYLKGRHHLGKSTMESHKTAFEYFKQAIDLDPTFALAYAGQAAFYLDAANVSMSVDEAIPRAQAAANRALALDPDLAEAHVQIGQLNSQYQWDWGASERAFRRAIQLNPSGPDAHNSLGLLLVRLGRFAEAQIHMDQARELDPLSPFMQVGAVWPLYFSRRYDEAISRLQRIAEWNPEFANVHVNLGWAYIGKRRYGQAITELMKGKALNAETTPELAHAYGKLGRWQEAEKLVKELEARAETDRVGYYSLAVATAGVGNTDRALGWLEQAYEKKDDFVTLMNVDPLLDTLRSDPRFITLLQRLNLPPGAAVTASVPPRKP